MKSACVRLESLFGFFDNIDGSSLDRRSGAKIYSGLTRIHV